jgi:pimeloyl-ACP methyl ester carboxylesterase
MTNDLLESTLPKAAESPPAPESEVFVMPCSISQRRFWVLDQLYNGDSALNIPLAVELSGPLDIAVLERALNAIVDRHEILRTSFAQIDGVAKQVIKSEAQLSLGVIDLRNVPVEKRAERIDQEMIAEAARPLSLKSAPILRTVLLRLSPKENILMLTLHHIIGDGWSNGLLVREVGVFYDALLHEKPVQLPPLAFQYADYALWQEEWLKTPQFEKQLDYWRETLDGDLPVLDIPTDFPRQAGQTYTAFIESLLLSPRLGEDLKRLCVDLEVTLFMVLFATYVTLLFRYTGQSRFLIGTTAANRNRTEMEYLIGLFANPLILSPEISGDMTFRQLAARLRDHSLNGFAHQEVPFEIVLEKLQERKTAGRKPAIQTHFLYQKAFMESATYGDLAIKPLRSVSPGSTFELTYGIVERPEGIRLQMEYHTALFRNSTIKRMLRHFQRLLEAAVENPDTLVSEMALLTDEEHARLNSTPAPKEAIKETRRPAFDSQSIIGDLQSQLSKHRRASVDARGALIEPRSGVVLFLLDSRMRLLPAGVPGGLYIGGLSLEGVPATAQMTGPKDSTSPIPLLSTDFIGLYREDGKIELLGNARDFALVNGFRVNLRQIEDLLQQHPGVREAAATVFPQPSGDKQLVAYVVAESASTLVEKDLRAFLKGKISEFTLPAHIVPVGSLPKDTKGEVVPELLPEPALPQTRKDEKLPLEAVLYQQLIEIWTEILKVPTLTIVDNFFALGGTSLLALRMMTEIEKLSGRPLPLSLLLTGATISNLARHIVEANNESALPLVTVQANGSRQPIFFLHGDWAGGGFYCGRLSQLLGENQPFYALPPYHSGEPRILTLSEMASHHIAAMKERSPKGPYLLGGYCIGATVAIEMARQLAEAGDQVTQLLLIDPPQWLVSWLRWFWPLVDKTGNLLNWDIQKKIYYFDRYPVSFARWLKKPTNTKVATLLRRLGLARTVVGTSPITIGREIGEEDREILNSLDYAVYFLAYRLYRLRPLTVPATIFFPEETPPTRAWVSRASERHPSKFAIEIVPGNHHTCVTRHTAALVDRIRKTLVSL